MLGEGRAEGVPFGPWVTGWKGFKVGCGPLEAVLGHLEYVLAQLITAEPIMLPGRLGLSCHPK